jgi:hypothetical protein
MLAEGWLTWHEYPAHRRHGCRVHPLGKKLGALQPRTRQEPRIMLSRMTSDFGYPGLCPCGRKSGKRSRHDKPCFQLGKVIVGVAQRKTFHIDQRGRTA